MNIAESLTAKVGPLPAWAWGLGLGGVIIGARAYRARHASSPVVAVTSDGETSTAGANPQGVPADAGQPGTVGGYTIPSGYQANPGGVIIGADGNLTDGAAGAVNNLDWSNQAFDVLRAQGYASLAASEAVRKYLAGEPITPAEEGMIGVALTKLGQPPEGAPAITKATDVGGSAATPTQQPQPQTQTYFGPGSPGWVTYDPNHVVQYISLTDAKTYTGTPVHDPSNPDGDLYVGADGRTHRGRLR